MIETYLASGSTDAEKFTQKINVCDQVTLEHYGIDPYVVWRYHMINRCVENLNEQLSDQYFKKLPSKLQLKYLTTKYFEQLIENQIKLLIFDSEGKIKEQLRQKGGDDLVLLIKLVDAEWARVVATSQERFLVSNPETGAMELTWSSIKDLFERSSEVVYAKN